MAESDQFHTGLDHAEIADDARVEKFPASILLSIWIAMIAGCFLFWATIIHFIAISL